jgi:hypothetical protein
MCNPNQFRACAAFCWSNQVAQVVRTAFFCQRWQRGSASHVTLAVSGASTLVAMGEYSQYFTVPVRFELRQQQFYDQVSNVAGRAVANNIFCANASSMRHTCLGLWQTRYLNPPDGVTNPEGH